MARDKAYRKAELCIEVARQGGATELDLSGMGLTEVPEAIGSLTTPKKFVATIEFRVQYFPTEIRPCAFADNKDTEDFRQRIDLVSIGGVMILRQLCAAIAPIKKIGAIAAPQPADLSRLDYI